MESSNRPSELRVRPYEAGDEQRIVPFLEKNMDWPVVQLSGSKVEHWQWKYLANPLNFQLVCVAEKGSEIVSHSASLPVRMKVGDESIVASQGVDLCTHPSLRGHGLIGMTMACRNSMKEEHGVELDFGFPNQVAYHVGSIKQGFRDLGVRMLQYQYIINEELFFRKVRFGTLKRMGYDSFQFLKRSIGRETRSIDGLLLGQERRFTPELDSLTAKASEDFDLMIERTSGMLNWRYADERGGTFIIRTVRKDGILKGYMVDKIEVRDGTRYLNIVDLMVDQEAERALPALLIDAFALAKERDIETILCCLPEGHPYGKVLSELGFLSKVRYTGDRPMSMILLDRTKDKRIDRSLTGPLRCHIVLGDTDWV